MSSSRPVPRPSGLSEQDQNLATLNSEMALSNPSPAKRRQSLSRSSGTKEQRLEEKSEGLPSSASFQLAVGKTEELSPRRKARRSMQPRKSILKPNVFSREDDTTDFTTGIGGRAEHTIAIGSLSRRVSFASKAYVRMFEKPTPKSPANKRMSLPSRQPAHSRRSSIQNIATISAVPRFVGEGEGEGEASMEMDNTASESTDTSDDEDGGAVVHSNPDGSRRYSGQGTQFSLGGASSVQIHHLENGAEGDGMSDDGEMDMEVTQVVYGGIMDRRASMANSEISEGDSLTSAGGEDQTVDFTIAVGGLMPHSPPVEGAANTRVSMGYAAPNSPSRYDGGEDEEVAMEETVAIGGIIGADDTMSTASSAGNETLANRERTMTFSFPSERQEEEDDMGMDMTIAIGGIMDRDMTTHRPTAPRPSTSTSPFRPITRPSSGTPSFARPTVSSATKISSATKPKRNIFGPSPSPTKVTTTTPRKSGMEIAGEVAARLSFGSNASASGSGKKRARSASIGEMNGIDSRVGGSPSKKRMLERDENVFTQTTTTTTILQRTETSLEMVDTPRKSVLAQSTSGTSSRLSVMPSKSPAKSPMLRRMLGHRPEEEDEGEEMAVDGDLGNGGDGDEFEPQTITLGSFLEMAGVQFIEALPAARRRSSIGKGVLGRTGDGEREFALHDYTAAQVNNVFLNMYSWAANRMKSDISESASQLSQTEMDCSIHNPPVIREYLSASDEEKKIFEMTFKAFKINTQLRARERWYDWKMDLMARVRPDVEEVYEGMKEDEKRLDKMEARTKSLLPELRARQLALMQELKKEREVVAELGKCDQEELKELREAINEQGAQIKAFSSELSESTSQLDKLQTSLGELQARKNEAVAAIGIAKGMCDQFTKSDVLRLQDEYKSLQSLHLWRPTFMSSTSFVLTYDAEISLHLNCVDSLPDIAAAKVERLSLNSGEKVGRAVGGVWKGEGDSPSVGLFKVFEGAVKELAKTHTGKHISLFVQRVGQLWSAAQRIRQELRLVHVQYPTIFTYSNPDSDSPIFTSTTTLMFPINRSKVTVGISFNIDMMIRWPDSVAEVDLQVKTIYGSADAKNLTEVAKRTVGMAVSEGYLGYLLQACVDVSET